MIKKIVTLLLCICIFSVSIPVMANSVMEKEVEQPVLRGPIHDFPASDVFGYGWRMIQSPITKIKSYNPITANQETIRDTMFFCLAPIFGGSVGASIFITTCVNRYVERPDYASIGGVYTKTYYLAKPTSESNQAPHINVPVTCKVKYVTIVYDSTSMISRNIIFYETKSDMIQHLPWYRYADPSTAWD